MKNWMIKNSKWLHSLMVILFCFMAFYTRVANIGPYVFKPDNEVRLLGVDPYFYLRHVETCYHNYPRIQKFDHATHYPNGIIADAAGLYVFFMASIVKTIKPKNATNQEIARIISWIPPILGALACLFIFLTGFHMYGYLAGYLGCLFYLIFPGLSLPRSVLGFVDHHVIEFLLALWILYGLHFLLKKAKNRPLYFPTWTSIPLVLIFLTWPGSPLYLIMLGVSLLVYGSFNKSSGADKKYLSIKLFRYFITTAIALLIINWIVPSFSAIVNNDVFHKILQGLVFLGVGLPVYILGAGYIEKKTGLSEKYGNIIFFLISAFLIYGILFYTNEGDQIRFWMGFKGTGLVESGEVNMQRFYFVGGFPGVISVIGAIVFLILHFLRKEKDFIVIPGIFVLFFSYMWWNTYDMGYMLGAMFAMFGGLVLFTTGSLYWDFVQKSFKNKRIGVVLKGIFSFLILLGFSYPFIWKNSLYPNTLPIAYMNKAQIYHPAWYKAMDWMRDNTPAPVIAIDSIVSRSSLGNNNTNGGFSHPENDYGVITAWDYGNLVNERARRTPVWSRWPSGPQTKWMCSTSEEEAARYICPSCEPQEEVRYAIVDSKMAGSYFTQKAVLAGKDLRSFQKDSLINHQGQNIKVFTHGPGFENSMVRKLHKDDGKGLQHYRLVWESPDHVFMTYMMQNNTLQILDVDIADAAKYQLYLRMVNAGLTRTNQGLYYGGYISPRIKIYEIVKGATVALKAKAGSRIIARLGLTSSTTNRELFYENSVIAEFEDEVQITLPYSNEVLSIGSVFTPRPSYTLEFTDLEGKRKLLEFSLTEEQIQKGETMDLVY